MITELIATDTLLYLFAPSDLIGLTPLRKFYGLTISINISQIFLLI